MPEHWLKLQLLELSAHVQSWRRASDADAARIRRQALSALMDTFVTELLHHDGVEGSFIAQDGLILHKGGALDFELECLAALSPHVAVPVDSDAVLRSLGRVGQMVLIGEQNKLILFWIDHFTIGIVAPTSTRLQQTLSQSSPQDPL